VECVCRTSAVMACAEYGDVAGVLLHSIKCDMSGNLDAGSCWTSTSSIRGGVADMLEVLIYSI
jgi:hypothetical protein